MKILIFGKSGQVGTEAYVSLKSFCDVVCLSYPEFDITDLQNLRKTIKLISPDIIYNAAGYTDVDKAESEPEKVFLVNALAPEVMAKTAANIRSLLIHFSTDYVYDGFGNKEYTEKDIPNPINLYGKSKLDGDFRIMATDCNHLIFRSSWIYNMNRGGFVLKVIDWAKKESELRIVDDQVSNPTRAKTIAKITSEIIKRWCKDKEFIIRNKGIYNLSAKGYASRYEWAVQILNLFQNKNEIKAKRIVPVPTSEFPTAAHRPLFTALNSQKIIETFEIHQPNWIIDLSDAMSENAFKFQDR